jgi:hypothetical protein
VPNIAGSDKPTNYFSRSFLSSGNDIPPGSIARDGFLWVPSKYNHGISGYLTMYAARDTDLQDYNGYNGDPYLTSTFTVNHFNDGQRMIFHFRVFPQVKGFRAAIWGRGCEFKGYTYPKVY